MENELREKAIQYLEKMTDNPKRSYEFSARELSIHLKKSFKNVYPFMEKQVAEGIWDTRMAFEPRLGRQIRVWWLIQPKE